MICIPHMQILGRLHGQVNLCWALSRLSQWACLMRCEVCALAFILSGMSLEPESFRIAVSDGQPVLLLLLVEWSPWQPLLPLQISIEPFFM